MVLLVTSGLLVRALWRLQNVDPGFRTAGVLTLRTALPMPKYAKTADRVRFYGRVLQEARRLPGVSGAAYVSFHPVSHARRHLAGEAPRRRPAKRYSARHAAVHHARLLRYTRHPPAPGP